MKYEQLLLQSTQVRCMYLADVLKAAVAEGRETNKPQGIAVAETLAVFSLNDTERNALQREAIERLHRA
ncbi:hypothetical protein D9M71_481060 [compost metagenome]